MRNHGGIHLLIAGMIAPLVKVVAGYGSTDGAVAPLWFAKETKLFEKR